MLVESRFNRSFIWFKSSWFTFKTCSATLSSVIENGLLMLVEINFISQKNKNMPITMKRMLIAGYIKVFGLSFSFQLGFLLVGV